MGMSVMVVNGNDLSVLGHDFAADAMQLQGTYRVSMLPELLLTKSSLSDMYTVMR